MYESSGKVVCCWEKLETGRSGVKFVGLSSLLRIIISYDCEAIKEIRKHRNKVLLMVEEKLQRFQQRNVADEEELRKVRRAARIREENVTKKCGVECGTI